MNNMSKVKIYKVWVGGNEFPEKLQSYIKTWSKIKNSKIITIDDSYCKNIDSRFVNWCYENKNWCCIANYMRAYLVYHFGGVYMDTDVEVVRDSELWKSETLNIGMELPNWANSHIIICNKPKNRHLEKLMELMDNWDFNNLKDIELETGPRLITKYLISKGYKMRELEKSIIFDDITIHPERVLSPHRWNETFKESEIVEDTLAIHHFTKLW